MTGSARPEAILVLNGTRKRSVRAKRLRQQLVSLGFPVAESEVRRYDAICDSCDTAVTRMDDSDAKEAAKDMDRLFTELVVPRLRATNIMSGSPSVTVLNEPIGGTIMEKAANE